jgi:hypothetical protein
VTENGREGIARSAVLFPVQFTISVSEHAVLCRIAHPAIEGKRRRFCRGHLQEIKILSRAFCNDQHAVQPWNIPSGIRRSWRFPRNARGGIRRVCRARPWPRTANRKFPVGSMVFGLQGSLKVIVGFGTIVRTPVVLSAAASPARSGAVARAREQIRLRGLRDTRRRGHWQCKKNPAM